MRDRPLSLHPVKTFIIYILAFYVLFSAVVPCSIFDSCEEKERTEQTSKTDQDEDCKNCSPFSICATCSGFTLNSIYTVIQPEALNASPVYGIHKFSSKSEYHPTLFQPPRLA